MTKRDGKTRRTPAKRAKTPAAIETAGYDGLIGGIGAVLQEARRTSARVVNTLLTGTYWEVGRRIVEHEQQGEARAAYGKQLLERLATDLTAGYGRGFGVVNLSQMKKFYRLWPAPEILQTPSEESEETGAARKRGILQTASEESALARIAARFPLPWSAYVRLLAVKSEEARYALENLPNKVLAAEYRTVLPDEKLLAAELEQTRRVLEGRGLERKRGEGE